MGLPWRPTETVGDVEGNLFLKKLQHINTDYNNRQDEKLLNTYL